MNTFADRLRYIRGLRGLTQQRLAKACGLSQSAIANYELGNRSSAQQIFRLADALQVNALWLKQGDGPMDTARGMVSAPYAYRVTDQGPPNSVTPWPFQAISPETYWALSDDDRRHVENTISALIESLNPERS